MRRSVAAALPLLALLAGCGGGAASGPRILYGEDICDRCRMVISERRHAAAARLDGGERRFDDPGCLLGFLAERGSTGGVELWVHDEAGGWLEAEKAWFVRDPDGGTPMASGLLAFGTAAAAADAGRRLGAEPVRWAELAAAPDGVPEGKAPAAG